MNIEEAVFDYLSTNAGIVALVGDRIYPKRLIQDPTLPAIVFQVVSAVPAYTNDQAGDPPVASSSYVRNRFQFDLWATSYEGLLPLRDALMAAISGFRGMMGTMSIQSVFVVGELDDFEVDTVSNRKIVDAIFSYSG